MKTFSAVLKETSRLNLKLIYIIVGLAAWLLVSCDSNEVTLDNSAIDDESAQFESEDDYFLEDIADMAATAVSQESSSGGKVSTDRRFDCAVVTRTGDENGGTIEIDFGDGCTGPRGHIRRGKIIIVYAGRYFTPGASWTTRFDEYYIDNVKVGGTRVVTNMTDESLDAYVFDVKMEDGTLTWPDGRVATRRVHHRREEHRDENHLLDRLIVYGTAEGNHRNARGFYIEILEPLVYKRECREDGVFIPVEGVKLIKHGQREITVDYGDGRCDNKVTITNKNGRSWEYEVGGH